MGSKEKLTLSVDKDVVEKAKDLGINISELTEKVLAGFTFEPTKLDESQVRAKYQELFATMVPLLKKFNTAVKVGKFLETVDVGLEEELIIELCSDGGLFAFYPDIDFEKAFNLQEINLNLLLPPNEILNEFIKAISEGAKKHKERLKELEMTKKIIEAISEFTKGR